MKKTADVGDDGDCDDEDGEEAVELNILLLVLVGLITVNVVFPTNAFAVWYDTAKQETDATINAFIVVLVLVMVVFVNFRFNDRRLCDGGDSDSSRDVVAIIDSIVSSL